MKLNCKWALVLLPLFFAGCEDKIEQPTPSIAYEGDDVRFSVDNSPNSRTMYQDDCKDYNLFVVSIYGIGKLIANVLNEIGRAHV